MKIWVISFWPLVFVFLIFLVLLNSICDADLSVSVIAGYYRASGSPRRAINAKLTSPYGIWVNSTGSIFFCDAYQVTVINSGIISIYGGIDKYYTYTTDDDFGFQFSRPRGIIGDSQGAIYFTDDRQIWKYSSGQLDVFAGNGNVGYLGDDQSDLQAVSFYQPVGLWWLATGQLLVTDSGNHRIRRISSTITTIAGTGQPGYNGEGIPALSTKLYLPMGVYVDSNGVVFFTEFMNHRVRKIVSGIVYTVAGLGINIDRSDYCYGGEGGVATLTMLASPSDVKGDTLGNLYIVENRNGLIRKVTPDGIISTIIGNGKLDFPSILSAASSTGLFFPNNFWITTSGDFYISDAGNQMIRKASATNDSIDTSTESSLYLKAIAGTGTDVVQYRPYAVQASIMPVGFCVNQSSLEIYFTATPHIYKIAKDGTFHMISSILCLGQSLICSQEFIYYTCANEHAILKFGQGTETFLAGSQSQESGNTGDGGDALNARFFTPCDLFLQSNKLYIADLGNKRVRVLDLATNIVSPYAGSGICCDVGDGSPALNAYLRGPVALYGNSNGDLFIADMTDARIRRVNSVGIISTYAGTGNSGLPKDNSVATLSLLTLPSDIIGDTLGNIYVADMSSVLKITPGGILTIMIGNTVAKLSRTFVPATHSIFNTPILDIDTSGTLYLATGKYIQKTLYYTPPDEIRYLRVQMVAGQGITGYYGDGQLAKYAVFHQPKGIWIDSSDNIYICDSSKRIRKISSENGTITTVAGNGASGDTDTSSGLAVSHVLTVPISVVGDTLGTIYFTNSKLIWNLTDGILNVLSGNIIQATSGDGGPMSEALWHSPAGLWLTTDNILYVSDSYDGLVRYINLTSGIVERYAGNVAAVDLGDGGLANESILSAPFGIYVDTNGNMYIADSGNNRIRFIDYQTKIISTFAGNGDAGYAGDGYPVSLSVLNYPTDVKGDLSGSIYISDSINSVIRMVLGGIIYTIVGDFNAANSVDNIPALESRISFPNSLWVDGNGTVYFTDGRSYLKKIVSVVPPSFPSSHPTSSPSGQPSTLPSSFPSTIPSVFPSTQPSGQPSSQPSRFPSSQPTTFPSVRPTTQPAALPSSIPSMVPSAHPSSQPSSTPSAFPSVLPSSQPSSTPSSSPSAQPSSFPSVKPSGSPSTYPSTFPTNFPTCFPTGQPSSSPSSQPTGTPSSRPNSPPSGQPSIHPTNQPTVQPSARPSGEPSRQPTAQPSSQPTCQPSSRPSSQPSRRPTSQPSSEPTRQPYSNPTSSPTLTHAPSLISAAPTRIFSIQPSSIRLKGFLFRMASSSLVAQESAVINLTPNLPTAISRIIFGQRNLKSSINFNNDQDSQASFVTIANNLIGDNFPRCPTAVGDINQDGFSDFIIGYPMSSYCDVYLGETNLAFSGIVSFRFIGESDKHDHFGWAVTPVFDMNEDGYSDILISAPNSGIVYLIYGRNYVKYGKDIDVSRLLPSQGMKIYGDNRYSNTGMSISSAGDFNGDNHYDLCISSFLPSTESMIYLVLGNGRSLPNILYLNNTSPSSPLLIYRILSPARSFAGFSISGLTDFNGDGLGDLVIGSIPYQGGYVDQRSYIIYGRSLNRTTALLPLDLLKFREGKDGVTVIGGGFLVAGIGDVNQDGLGDALIINYRDWNQRSNAYIFTYPGRMSSPPTMFPSSSPSSLPSCSPSQFPSAQPTSSPSQISMKPTIKLKDNETFAPTSRRPTFIRSTFSPSFLPTTISPTRRPSPLPSITPTEMPLISPTRSPASIPSRRPTYLRATRLPTFIPTIITNLTFNSSYDEHFIQVNCEKSGRYGGQIGKFQYFIKNDGYYRFIRNDYSINIYIPYPAHSVIYIDTFYAKYDYIDLSLFPKFQHFKSLSYATNPLTLYLLTDQVIILANLQDINELTADNFFFRRVDHSIDDGSNITSQAGVLISSALVFLFMLCVASHIGKDIVKQKKVKSQIVSSNNDHHHHSDAEAPDEGEDEVNGSDDDEGDEEAVITPDTGDNQENIEYQQQFSLFVPSGPPLARSRPPSSTSSQAAKDSTSSHNTENAANARDKESGGNSLDGSSQEVNHLLLVHSERIAAAHETDDDSDNDAANNNNNDYDESSSSIHSWELSSLSEEDEDDSADLEG